jgi:hypothetical protein
MMPGAGEKGQGEYVRQVACTGTVGIMETQVVEARVIAGSGNGHVEEVVRQAHEELRQLLHQRAEVMRRIGTIKQTIAGLANLFGESVLNDELLELVDRRRAAWF